MLLVQVIFLSFTDFQTFYVFQNKFLKMQRVLFCRNTSSLNKISRFLSTNLTEDGAQIMEHFGGTKRLKDDNTKLFTCEELISGWKSVMFLKEAVGSRSYAFQGNCGILN